MNLPEQAQEKLLLRASELSFFNTSPMDLSKLGQAGIKDNLESYIQSFSQDAREIFEYFNFAEFIGQLNDADLLFKIVQKVCATDLTPKTPSNPNGISNHDMGLVFEELIRRFAEGSNETAGEHFTPRDIVRLTTSLVFMEDDEALRGDGIIRSIYDPTAGTGGFLSAGMEYLYEMNPNGRMAAFGQELNPESYAICKADMLIKGQAVNNIKLGNTLSNDQLGPEQFDYMLSNPPFGVDWKKIEASIKDEHTLKGFEGRFGAGLPRVSDGSLLFLMHLISKLPNSTDRGGRIGIILNGSPLFTGGAGSGESEIRRYILEADLLEAIVALPTDMFYNTGIATYVWVLSNKKTAERRGKVQLINGVNLCAKMRKSLGSKRHEMSEDDIATITRSFGAFEVAEHTLNKPAAQKSNRGRQAANPKQDPPKTFASKIFETHQFGYRRISIERPLRESYQFSDARIAELRFAPKPLNAAMQWLDALYPFSAYPNGWRQHEAAIRKHVKAHFSDLKEAKIKELLNPQTWQTCQAVYEQALALQSIIGSQQHDDKNTYEEALKAACKQLGLKLETKAKKAIEAAVSWKNPSAQKVIKKVVNEEAAPLYGAFAYTGHLKAYQGKIVEYKADGDLRDNENVALNPAKDTYDLIEGYFIKEVQPHVPEAWIDDTKRDDKDGEIGIVGYEIPFNRHFYQYQPPRDLEAIDADLDKVSAEIMNLLQEVHS